VCKMRMMSVWNSSEGKIFVHVYLYLCGCMYLCMYGDKSMRKRRLIACKVRMMSVWNSSEGKICAHMYVSMFMCVCVYACMYVCMYDDKSMRKRSARCVIHMHADV
jgi:hypothetical protein